MSADNKSTTAAAATTAAATTAAAPTPKPASDVKYNFKGKLALVTGSTLGIGYSIALEFVRAGASVVVNGRDAKTVASIVAKLEKERVYSDSKVQAVHGVAADVGTAAGAKQLIAAVDAIAPLDFLINNASIFVPKAFEEIDDDEWLRYHNLNLMSVVRLSRHYLPAMIKRNAHGRVITISSEVAFKPMAAMIPYSVSKGAQVNLMRGLAETTKGSTVTVNSVLPGPTWTEGVDSYLKGRLPMVNAERAKEGKPAWTFDEFASEYCKTTEPTSLLARLIQPEEVALGTLYLCTQAGGVTNGHAMRIEGGIIRHT